MKKFVVVQSLSCVRLFATPWTAACPASLSQSFSQSLPKFMSIASVMPSNHLILWCSLLLPSIFLSIRVFSKELSVCIRWPKYWSFSFSLSPSSEYSELISHKIDWFDFLDVQGTFRSLLQHYSSKASILGHSAFFTVQLLQPYVTTGKTIALTIRTFVGRVMSLLFNILSRFVIAFLTRSNHLASKCFRQHNNMCETKYKGGILSSQHYIHVASGNVTTPELLLSFVGPLCESCIIRKSQESLSRGFMSCIR